MIVELEEGFEVIEFSTDNNIRMLEQLNKTLELLQADREITVSEEKSARRKTEESVLDCICMICTPIVAFKAESAPPAEDVARKALEEIADSLHIDHIGLDSSDVAEAISAKMSRG